MHRLKRRLRELDMYDYESVVCNCHADNRLSDILRLVHDGRSYNLKSYSERLDYGKRLAAALRDFTSNFLPHMEEEEEVFQPMLVKFFEYDELKWLKKKVIEQHKKHEIVQEEGVPLFWSEFDDDVDAQYFAVEESEKFIVEEDFNSSACLLFNF